MHQKLGQEHCDLRPNKQKDDSRDKAQEKRITPLQAPRKTQPLPVTIVFLCSKWCARPLVGRQFGWYC